jgi:hypothetical protein
LSLLFSVVGSLVAVVILSSIYTNLWVFLNYIFSSGAAKDLSADGSSNSRYGGNPLALLMIVFAVVLPIGYGIVFGGLMGVINKDSFKSDGPQRVFVILFTLIALYASWLSWFYFTTGAFLITPWALWGGISGIFEHGLTSAGWRRHSFELYVPWVIESLLVFAGVAKGWLEATETEF